MRYTLAVDFDGVVHMYTTPFQGAHRAGSRGGATVPA